ncbi:pentatricopeptide repeat-containing protein At4g21190 [Cannabis sativa]|uniref:pentatricopeptide repeat-containing protein At4g21190 n=1 Tax=Cannabis sativa TaxID=3483 RepID=UPI0029CA1740|nr:pentatricopeptide repeat-containing protein At4g21190 [Cannabis sativa]XP_030501253.2 pentatricopeptide repeat-containing protein At4g21190 [Cannabis sativa]
MLALRCFPPVIRGLELVKISWSTSTTTRTSSRSSVVVCAAKGPRPRYARVWKTNKRIGTVSKSAKLVKSIKEVSNVKEEVYGALDSFIAWELEFPLITVKKAIKILEDQKEWKRIIQMSKWMLSKGQGRTMGTYFRLLNALAEDGRLEEAEELWAKLFSENLESTPRMFFNKMLAIYYHRGLHDKMFEIFADMEELGIRPNVAIVSMMGKVFQQLGMLDKYDKLNRKYPPPKWQYRYIRGRRVKIQAKDFHKYDDDADQDLSDDENSIHDEINESSADEHGDVLEPEDVNVDSSDMLEETETRTNETLNS